MEKIDLKKVSGYALSLKRDNDLPNPISELPWGTTNPKANLLYELITRSKARVILETGTFAGHGTFIMAKALSKLNGRGIIYTIDYDGDPLSNELKLKNKDLIEKARYQNFEKIESLYPNVDIIFINGKSDSVLPSLNNDLKFDFFFQDSSHDYDGVKTEWELIKPFLHSNSMCFFDDISLEKDKITTYIKEDINCDFVSNTLIYPPNFIIQKF